MPEEFGSLRKNWERSTISCWRRKGARLARLGLASRDGILKDRGLAAQSLGCAAEQGLAGMDDPYGRGLLEGAGRGEARVRAGPRCDRSPGSCNLFGAYGRHAVRNRQRFGSSAQPECPRGPTITSVAQERRPPRDAVGQRRQPWVGPGQVSAVWWEPECPAADCLKWILRQLLPRNSQSTGVRPTRRLLSCTRSVSRCSPGPRSSRGNCVHPNRCGRLDIQVRPSSSGTGCRLAEEQGRSRN
jgi:hypothetical protein